MKNSVKSELCIVNGKLESENYKHDFHTFFHQRTIELFVLLPGINAKSVIVKNSGSQISIDVHIKQEYHQIFKGNKIRINGELPCKTHPNAIVTSYEDGILKIELARKITD